MSKSPPPADSDVYSLEYQKEIPRTIDQGIQEIGSSSAQREHELRRSISGRAVVKPSVRLPAEFRTLSIHVEDRKFEKQNSNSSNSQGEKAESGYDKFLGKRKVPVGGNSLSRFFFRGDGLTTRQTLQRYRPSYGTKSLWKKCANVSPLLLKLVSIQTRCSAERRHTGRTSFPPHRAISHVRFLGTYSVDSVVYFSPLPLSASSHGTPIFAFIRLRIQP